jgi:hypothetical protein
MAKAKTMEGFQPLEVHAASGAELVRDIGVN